MLINYFRLTAGQATFTQLAGVRLRANALAFSGQLGPSEGIARLLRATKAVLMRLLTNEQ